MHFFRSHQGFFDTARHHSYLALWDQFAFSGPSAPEPIQIAATREQTGREMAIPFALALLAQFESVVLISASGWRPR